MKNIDDDIEILDLDDNLEESKTKKNIKNPPKKKLSRVKKKKNDKSYKIQMIFCTLSLVFILGCCIFYGSRLFKYYVIYNPKTSSGEKIDLLANEITKKSSIVYEDSGLYINSGNYIYKGDVSNNYIRFSNMLWRIIRINADSTIEIILDDYINMLHWNKDNSSYINSDIYHYLNDYFLKQIDKSMLTNMVICTDEVLELTGITCNEKNSDSYVNLLDIKNFLNSVVSSKTYLNNADEIYWLRDYAKDKIWHTNGYNVSQSDSNNFYAVRPVVRLKSSTVYYGGNGTKDNPYIISEKNQIGVGSYVKLGEDNWIVYNNNENFELMKETNLSNQNHFSSSSLNFNLKDDTNIAKYLNTTYLDSLSYKDKLVDNTWYIGNFKKSYKDILKNKVVSKVALPNLIDLKFNSNVDNYFLATNNDKMIYVYGNVLKLSKPIIYRGIRPCIALSKNVKIKSGNGTLNNPYVLED